MFALCKKVKKMQFFENKTRSPPATFLIMCPLFLLRELLIRKRIPHLLLASKCDLPLTNLQYITVCCLSTDASSFQFINCLGQRTNVLKRENGN